VYVHGVIAFQLQGFFKNSFQINANNNNIKKRPVCLSWCLKFNAEYWIKHLMLYSQSITDFVGNVTNLLLCNLWVLQELVSSRQVESHLKTLFAQKGWYNTSKMVVRHWPVNRSTFIRHWEVPLTTVHFAFHFYEKSIYCVFCFPFSWKMNSIHVQLPSTFCTGTGGCNTVWWIVEIWRTIW